jgi:hypothetical protein
MKDQYFGDVNDFRKYILLRALVLPDRLRLGVCWMLTPADSRTDGNFLAYLRRPEVHRRHDPELFDWLKQVVEVERDRRTARIETSSLFGPASFHSEALTDSEEQRGLYFSSCPSIFAGCDLVFFDPDNGLEVRSKPRGRKDSCKYIYWEEIEKTFSGGSSVLVYQHFPRVKRERYMDRTAQELRKRTATAAVFSFRTSQVLFLLAARGQHAATFRARVLDIQSHCDPGLFVAYQH